MTLDQRPKRILVSAPGKVILFGEHAVVHQKLAIAASLGLRTYLYVERTQGDICRLKLPNVQISMTWSLKDFPLHLDLGDQAKHPLDMPQELKQHLEAMIGTDAKTDAQRQALLAFLYLFVILAPKDKPLESGFTMCSRSMLPVSAGLGSSASYSAAIAAGLLILFNHIPVDFIQSPEKETYLETINRYAFKAEQVIHGNPSGVDNAVATFGGAKAFRRGQGLETLEGCQSLRLLLTNTKVPRSTNALVAGVTAKKEKYPGIINPILDAIDGIALRCQDAFKRAQRAEIDQATLIHELEDLVDMNHCLLYSLGVSHASLEKVRLTTAGYGIKTKLTGAGGGGCALSLLNEGISAETIQAAIAELANNGFDCYQTSLGGVGVSASVLADSEDETWMDSADRRTLESHVV